MSSGGMIRTALIIPFTKTSFYICPNRNTPFIHEFEQGKGTAADGLMPLRLPALQPEAVHGILSR